MKPVYQTRFGGIDTPQEEQGNCFQACVASVLELPLEEAFTNIPYEQVNGGKPGEWFDKFNEWLARYGLGCIAIDVDKDNPPAYSTLLGYHIAQVDSVTLRHGDAHVVVIYNGEVVHDPNPNAESLGKMRGYYLFVTLNPSRTQGV